MSVAYALVPTLIIITRVRSMSLAPRTTRQDETEIHTFANTTYYVQWAATGRRTKGLEITQRLIKRMRSFEIFFGHLVIPLLSVLSSQLNMGV